MKHPRHGVGLRRNSTATKRGSDTTSLRRKGSPPRQGNDNISPYRNDAPPTGNFTQPSQWDFCVFLTSHFPREEGEIPRTAVYVPREVPIRLAFPPGNSGSPHRRNGGYSCKRNVIFAWRVGGRFYVRPCTYPGRRPSFPHLPPTGEMSVSPRSATTGNITRLLQKSAIAEARVIPISWLITITAGRWEPSTRPEKQIEGVTAPRRDLGRAVTPGNLVEDECPFCGEEDCEESCTAAIAAKGSRRPRSSSGIP